jgi:uncharacterized protein YeaO (DUF488 family)
MPIQHAIWTIGSHPKSLTGTRLESEQQLEEMIVSEPSILSSDWMLIGRQEVTSHGGRLDLLAVAPDGSLILIELKRDRTPRDITAQALDYASWLEDLEPENIARIFHRFSNGQNLDDAFRERFGSDLDEESLNRSHQIVIVAAELDDATERIIGYLNSRDIAINVLFFQVFEHNGEKFLSRAWLIDPGETQANVVSTAQTVREREPWNGEYYVSYGGSDARSWEEARKYGYISAGGGRWYSQTLNMLSPGDRVWVNIPRIGYVGVGRVRNAVVSVNEFDVDTDSGEKPILDVLEQAEHFKSYADDPEKAEYFVAIDWLETAPEGGAFNEVGLFGNQNTVCQPTTPKWRHTVERLKTAFTQWDSES